MEGFKLGTKLKLLFIFCFVVLAYYNFSNIKCTYFGNLVFDKIFNINNDCYKRKLKGVIYPSVKNLDARYSYLKNKKIKKCPKDAIVVLISGQSNASNFLKSKKKYKNKHLNYFNGKCYNLSNPVLGAEGEMSSLIPALATKLISTKKIIFVTSGRGGMPMSHANHDNKIFINYNKNILDNLEKNENYLKFFIWIQGESDAGNSKNYLNDFTEMFENITRDLKYKDEVNLIISQTSRCYEKEDPKLRKIQKNISNNRNKYIKVINTDDLDNNYRYDDCHFNELGIDKLSDEFSKIINLLNK